MDWFFLTNYLGFLIGVFFLAQAEAHLIKADVCPMKYFGKSVAIVQYEFKEKLSEEYSHLGSTNQFMFLFNKKENCTLVVPISDFLKLKINLEKKNY